MESDVEVVRDQLTTELGLAIGLVDKFQLGISLPFAVYQNGDDFDANGVPTGEDLSGGSMGDIRIEGKYQAPSFGSSQEFTFAIVPGLTIPTGDDEKFYGDKTVTGRLKAITEMQLEPVRAAAMLGVLLRDPSHELRRQGRPAAAVRAGGRLPGASRTSRSSASCSAAAACPTSASATPTPTRWRSTPACGWGCPRCSA